MPQHTKGARLYWRDDKGKWYIRDGARFLSTRTSERREADKALARYIAEREQPAGPRSADQLTVAEALSLYADEHGGSVRAPATVGYSIKALLPILGELPVGSINKAVCGRYARERGVKPGTVRRELGVLQAAVNHCHAQAYLLTPIKVTLPAAPAPRDRWLERREVAALLRAARRNPKARHLARFILLAVYTGTRSDAILRLQFERNPSGDHVDTEAGVLYRRAEGEAETKKRTPPVPIPPRLLAHLRRWERMGARHVVEVDGRPVGSLKTAWRTALRESGIEHATKHDLRHTAVTWAMRKGAAMWDAAGYFGLSRDMLESVYGHHHPDHMGSVVEAMGRRA